MVEYLTVQKASNQILTVKAVFLMALRSKRPDFYNEVSFALPQIDLALLLFDGLVHCQINI